MPNLSEIDLFDKCSYILREIHKHEWARRLTNNHLFYLRKFDEHQIEQIKFLNSKYQKSIIAFSTITFILRIIPVSVFEFAKNYLSNLMQRKNIDYIINSEANILIISHGIRNNENIAISSFVAGVIERMKRPSSCDVFLISHTSRFKKRLNSDFSQKHRVLLPIVKSRDFFKILLKNLSLSLQILSAVYFGRDLHTYSRCYLAKSLILQFSKSSIYIDLIVHQMKSVVEKSSFETILIPFEGHALEASFVDSLSNLSNRPRIVLYQHAPIVTSQLGFIQGLRNFSEDIYLVVTGKLLKIALEREIPNLRGRIKVVGSDKFDVSHKIVPSTNKITHKVLLVPEASAAAIHDILIKAKEFMQLETFHEFTMRFHPNYRLQRKDMVRLKGEFSISISNKSLTEDLGEANFCFFRGSSVAMQALSYGMIPIYCSSLPPGLLNPLEFIKSEIHIGLWEWLGQGYRHNYSSEWHSNRPKGLIEMLTEIGINYFSPFVAETIRWIEDAKPTM